MAYLVLIETSGNQRYIFSTNRLRENAGASEMVFRAGTEFVVNAIDDVVRAGGKNSPYGRFAKGEAAARRVERLIEIGEKQGPLENCGVEVIVSTSGKTLLLVEKRDIGEQIISRVTEQVLRECPGLVVMGVVGTDDLVFPGDKDKAHAAVKQVHRAVEELKTRLPSPLGRFPAIPFVQPCESSGLPANGLAKKPGGRELGAFSRVVVAKRDMGDDGFKRVKRDTGQENLAHSPNTLERMEQLDWLAIVHADGNGFGKLFINFGDERQNKGLSPGSSGRAYFDLLRRFSASLELCGLEAFREAIGDADINELRVKGGNSADDTDEERFLPIVPLILGGDDLSIVMDGRQALRFTASYLKAFEKATNCHRFGELDNAIRTVTGGEQLGAGAGVAIVKPHYPFHRAYELAESLIRSAKRSKSVLGTSAVSAVDFHVLFDNGATDFSELRDLLKVGEGEEAVNLTMRPYVVSENADKLAKTGQDWIVPRKWEDLNAIADDLSRSADASDPEKTIPNSQLHVLRDALFEGRGVAEARFKLIRGRYSNLGFTLFENNGEPDESRQMSASRLIDAMEVIDIERRYQTGASS